MSFVSTRPLPALTLVLLFAFPAAGRAVDNDGDGLQEDFEATLMQRFAPVVRLQPDDVFRPSSVDWYLQRTHMRFHHSGCSDDQILGKGGVDPWNISAQSHRNKSGIFCSHSGTTEFSDLRTEKSRFFLQIPNDASESTTRLGAPQAEWTCYAHVRHAPGSNAFDIQYWFYYPYNGDLAGNGSHEGDWEHVTVRTNDAASVLQVYYAAHDGEGRWYTTYEISLSAGTRPYVYSAWHSHASYPRAGTWNRSFPLPADYANDGGPAWDCRTRLVNMGEKGRPLDGKTWLNYSGRWGEIGPVFSGPFGPALQGSWNGD
jgi:hypothetical protein